MIFYQDLLLIFFLHWIGDFVLQSDWMAKNKSKSNKPLLLHVFIYTVTLLLIHPLWALVNGVLHGVTDYFTSRLSSKLWSKGETHNFFVVIGFDQFIHAVSLVTTYYWLIV